MTHTKKSDIKLRNELVIIVIIKVLLLILIWWLFFKDTQVNVNDDMPGGHGVTTLKAGPESGRQ